MVWGKRIKLLGEKMRYLILIVLSMGLSLTACSNKKSSSVATAPATTTTTTTNTNTNVPAGYPSLPAPVNTQYYVSTAAGYYFDQYYYDYLYIPTLDITSVSNYSKFLLAGLPNIAPPSGFSASYSCNFNLFSWIFDGNAGSCSSSTQNSFLSQMAAAPALMTLTISSNGQVSGNWLVDAYQLYGGAENGVIDYYMAIPFQGTIAKYTSGNYTGMYYIQAGPLLLISTTANTLTQYKAWIYDNSSGSYKKFANVTVR
jgi:hypothetical protein